MKQQFPQGGENKQLPLFVNGEGKIYEFENGYGASIICHQYSYGGNEGLLELAVLKDGDLCFDTPVTDDVVGYLTTEQATDILEEIKSLPSSPTPPQPAA